MKTHQAKLTILSLLSDGQFYSGEYLGEKLGVSRAAVSKHIKGIQDWGVDVFRVQGKGYQLAQPIQLLNEDLIRQHVSNPIAIHPIIDSTNQYLLERAGEIESGTVCLAEYQSKGRGRRGRQWNSPFGSNLYFSMYWKLEAGMAAAMGLSLVVGIAVIDALKALGVNDVKLKWPNDLYYQDKKLAGILVEVSGQAGDAAHLIIGMGMNLFMRKEEISIEQPWTTLSQVLGEQMIDRNELAVALIRSWNETLKGYEEKGIAGFVDSWNEVDNFINRPVKLLMGERIIRGIERGIDAHGAVLLETEEGIRSFVGGEISLRSDEKQDDY
ncbi:bifunctional biotin--[acetyl-CoA-carboxylase] ligase/biotin operon repressor BirA [Vibrio quintilis]|uniref:Bifunctional ligase/repressor BirA n=1 Tax=Vibrio quintilis TaxID=1117707 RepID=A0A1M7YZA1_9VIBR|nr:bifunctional biotin--[acetyl-CoA-carboxylase] ligase/biotin operon repressor BirA [Vibrio quintilis]SHO58027.1 Bifunctional ligase/repressor BirA [Vibrio quintilis]